MFVLFFAHSTVALYYEPDGEMVCMFQGHQGGVTHIQFTPDGTKLLTGGRKVGTVISLVNVVP